MSISVKYFDMPEGVQQDMSLSSTGAQSFATSADIASGSPDRGWASLERGLWKLDGTRKIIDNTNNIGWWSGAVSGSGGSFATPPVLTLSFGSAYSSTGFTFTFSPVTEQWCSEISIAWYNGSSLMDSGTFYPNKAVWTLERTVESFNKMVITVKKTNIPGRFARISSIQIGQVIWFGSDELISVDLLNEVDPSCASLPVDSMTVNIRDGKGRTFLPQNNQKMELYKNNELLAAHFITDAGREDKNTYSFTCQSLVGLLEDEFLGGIYSKTPVRELLDDILDSGNYELDPQLEGVTLSGYLPISTRRQALQQVALAIGGVVTTYGSEKVCLKVLSQVASGGFSGGEIFPGASLSKAQRVAEVKVTAHTYTPTEEREELVNEEWRSGGTHYFTFSEPHHSYEVLGSLLGNRIIASGPNWMEMEGYGPIIITGAKYSHSTKTYSKKDPLATAAEKGNVLSVSECTLISDDNAKAVLERLYNFAGYRCSLTQEAVIADNKAGDMVESESPWGTTIKGFITSMDSAFTRNGHTANLKIIGGEEL